MGNEMTVYYANFNMDNDFALQVDHSLWLNVLLLLTDSILIPPTHLLRTRFENISILKEYAPYISNGTIHTNLYSGFSSVSEYLQYKIDETSEEKALYNQRLNIIADLFSSSASYIYTDASQQSGVYTEVVNDKLKKLRQKQPKSFSENEYRLIQDVERNLFEKNSRGFIYRFEIENEINQLYLNKKIRNFSRKHISKILDEAYYIAGAIHNSAIIIHPQTSDSMLIPEKYGGKQINILCYDPKFFLTVLQSLNIISNFDEFNRIDCSEIRDLRNTKVFRDFITEYRKLCEAIYSYKDISHMAFIADKKKIYQRVEVFSDIIYALGLLPIDIYIGIIEEPFNWPIITIVKVILDHMFKDVKLAKTLQKSIPDKICSTMLKILDPFSAFCYNLKKAIEYKSL